MIIPVVAKHSIGYASSKLISRRRARWLMLRSYSSIEILWVSAKHTFSRRWWRCMRWTTNIRIKDMAILLKVSGVHISLNSVLNRWVHSLRR